MGQKLNREKVYSKTDGRCAYCGCDIGFTDFVIDHITPKAKGGNSRIENLIPSCRDCNAMKYDSDIETFRKKIVSTISETFHGRIVAKYYDLSEKPIIFYFEKDGGVCNGNL